MSLRQSHWDFYRFKGTFLTLFVFPPAASANCLASETLCCITVYHAAAVWAFWKVHFFILFGDFPNSRTAEKHCGLHPASICALEGKSEKKTPPADVAGGVHSAARGQMNIRHASPYLLARTYFSISLNSPLVWLPNIAPRSARLK